MPVYFVQAGERGPVKIGTASDPIARMRELQVGNPAELRLLRVVDGGAPEESKLHSLFSRHRIRGEWFNFSREMLDLDICEDLRAMPSVDGPPLERAFAAAGNATRLAEALGISIQAVMQWKRVPPMRVLQVERLTGVSRTELRPDIYPPEDGVTMSEGEG